MNRRILWNIVLILLPVLTVGLESMPDSVMVRLSQTQTKAYSFFYVLPTEQLGLCTPFAAVFTCLIPMFAIGYVISKRPFCLKAVMGFSFVALFLAVLPFLVQPEQMIVPNVGVAILMGMECILARVLGKKKMTVAEDDTVAPRLGGH